MTLMLIWVIKKAYPMFGKVQHRLDDLNTVMQENLAGVRVVKAFVRAAHEITRFGRVNDALMDQTVRAARTVAVTWPFMMMAVNLGVIGALWFGGALVNNGDMQIGQLIAFVNYLMRTLMSLMFVSMLIMRMARAQASAERVQEVMDAVPEVQTKPDALADFAPRGRVAFEGVTFSYDSDGRDLVLGGGKPDNGGPPGISFVAEPGQTVAVLGATGSGKSSLGQPDPALLRRDCRARDDRWRGRPRPGRDGAAPQHWHRAAGVRALQRHHPRQHPLRAAGGHR